MTDSLETVKSLYRDRIKLTSTTDTGMTLKGYAITGELCSLYNRKVSKSVMLRLICSLIKLDIIETGKTPHEAMQHFASQVEVAFTSGHGFLVTKHEMFDIIQLVRLAVFTLDAHLRLEQAKNAWDINFSSKMPSLIKQYANDLSGLSGW